MRLAHAVVDRFYPHAPGFVVRWLRSHSHYYEETVYLVSFPKCGRTWLRVLLGKALALGNRVDVSFEDTLCLTPVTERIPTMPDVRVLHYDKPQMKRAEELTKDYSALKHKKIILLVRDVRDVLVSMFFQYSRRQNSKRVIPREYLSDISTYVNSPIGSLDTFLKYYSIWADNRDVPAELLLVRYEDLHRNPQHELRRMLSVMQDREFSDELLAEAVRFASFNNMRRLEKAGSTDRPMFKPGNVDDPESYKTRRGKVAGFAEYLSAADIEYISRRAAEELPALYRYSFLLPKAE
jgi:hypothetical protein